MAKRRTALVISLFLFIAAVFLFSDQEFFPMSSITGSATADALSVKEQGIEPIVLFCPRDACLANLLELVNASTTIHCAFFDLNLPDLIAALQAKNALVVVDNDNREGLPEPNNFMRFDNANQLSHNKFCIFDNTIVWTGSMNPTKRDTEVNNNNVVVLQSTRLAANYEQEFQELWGGIFGKGDAVPHPLLSINDKRIENYFCPDDFCADKVIKTISSANESIYFMAFSFTHDGIGAAVLDAAQRGVDVHGIMEKSQNNQYHEFEKFASAGLDVSWDGNSANMHHKVFIIDKKIVITGSFNPSKNADERNDENILILYDDAVAQRFLDEYAIVNEARFT